MSGCPSGVLRVSRGAIRPLCKSLPPSAGKDTLTDTKKDIALKAAWLRHGKAKASYSMPVKKAFDLPVSSLKISQSKKKPVRPLKGLGIFGHVRMPRLADDKQVDPAASCPEVDPSIGASDRMSGIGKCQTVKAGVLSRWKSPVIRQGEGWHRDSP
jgi:hypothetical protein